MLSKEAMCLLPGYVMEWILNEQNLFLRPLGDQYERIRQHWVLRVRQELMQMLSRAWVHRKQGVPRGIMKTILDYVATVPEGLEDPLLDDVELIPPEFLEAVAPMEGVRRSHVVYVTVIYKNIMSMTDSCGIDDNGWERQQGKKLRRR